MPHVSTRPRKRLASIWPSREFMAVVTGFVIASIIDTVIHESGHALTALALGFQLGSFQVGTGEIIASVNLYGVDFLLLEDFIFGGGRVFVSEPDLGLAMFLVVLAGPLFPVLLGILLMIVHWGSSKIWLPFMVFMCNWSFMFSGFINLIPSSIKADGTKLLFISTLHMPRWMQGFWFNWGYAGCVIVAGAAYVLFIWAYSRSLRNARYTPDNEDFLS